MNKVTKFYRTIIFTCDCSQEWTFKMYKTFWKIMKSQLIYIKKKRIVTITFYSFCQV